VTKNASAGVGIAVYARTNGIPRAATICMISRVFSLLAARDTVRLYAAPSLDVITIYWVFRGKVRITPASY